MRDRARLVATAGALLALSSCSEDRAVGPATGGGVHAEGFADPATAGWHGGVLREKRWAQMLDPNDPDACGRCHDGAPTRPAKVTFAAPGAPACTSCHKDSGGALACTTCHDAARSGAHAAHIAPSATRAAGFACGTCHPTPGTDVIDGLHGNGHVEILFDTSIVVTEASWDPASHACAVSCHDRGGARPRLAWTEKGPLACGDCHSSPPRNHYAGACTTCHRDADATGTSLIAGSTLHLNGRVDLGDGSGKCGACHGRGDDPWPRTAAHASHEAPTIAAPIDCASCHVVPNAIHDPGHLDGTVRVAFSGRALDRGAAPSWDGRSCSSVACHGAGLRDPVAAPVWTDTSGAARACGACHGIPPTQHTASVACGRSECHGSEVAGNAQGIPFITPSGKALHVDGIVELRTP